MPSVRDLQQRVFVETCTEAKDEHGQVSRTWGSPVGRWAAVRALSNKERMIAQQAGSEAVFEVAMRYYEGLTNDQHRIVHEGYPLYIESVIDPDMKKEWTVVLCKAEA